MDLDFIIDIFSQLVSMSVYSLVQTVSNRFYLFKCVVFSGVVYFSPLHGNKWC